VAQSTAHIARQKEIDASIAAKADSEYLYDKPYEDKSKVRVAGPFTVESLSPHRSVIVNDDDTIIDPLKQGATAEGATDFAQMILSTLRVSPVQQAHKNDRISFESLDGWPGVLLAGKGSYREADGRLKTAGIFIGPEFGTVPPWIWWRRPANALTPASTCWSAAPSTTRPSPPSSTSSVPSPCSRPA
jgi:adenine-specific DNA-methyltransferase